MLVIGLTGSIGMGKTTTVGFFKKAGLRVHDADSAVHELYQGAAAPIIEAAFPNTTLEGKVDRNALFSQITDNPNALSKLEAIIHPMVADHRDHFLNKASCDHQRIVMLDVPLLFETETNKLCDVIIVVSAPFHIQKQRVLARAGMTEARFETILKKQMPDELKRRKAHFIVDTGRGMPAAEKQVQDIMRCLYSMPGCKLKKK